MAKFVLTAQLLLKAPANTKQVLDDIRRGLSGVDVPVRVKGTTAAKKNIDSVAQSAKRAGDSAKKMGQSFGLAFKRFAAFTVASRAVSLFTNTLANSITEAIEFQREMIKISQVTGNTVTQLGGLRRAIDDLSTSLGVSSKELLEVSRILAQAGLRANELETALAALAKTRLAPTFDDITQTAEGAVAIMAQFGLGASELEHQLGMINAVAGKFAVESKDLIGAVRRVGGVFVEAGGSLEDLLGLFTSVRATTRESAESIATGLRTILTRIQRPRTIEFLKQFGVELTDLNGKFVGPREAIRRLNKELSGLGEGDIRFIKIAEEIAGFRQIGKVLPLIKEFELAERARQTALAGGTSLTDDAATAQLALAIQITKVKEEFAKLIREISETGTFQAFIKTGLTLAETFITIAGALKPLIPLLAALMAFKAAKSFGGFASGFGSAVRGVQSFDPRGGPPKKAKGGRIHAFARGGVVPGTGSGDTVPAVLQPGEFVIRKSSVKKIGSANLAAMNENKHRKGGKIQLNPGAIGGFFLNPQQGERSFNLKKDVDISNPLAIQKLLGRKSSASGLKNQPDRTTAFDDLSKAEQEKLLKTELRRKVRKTDLTGSNLRGKSAGDLLKNRNAKNIAALKNRVPSVLKSGGTLEKFMQDREKAAKVEPLTSELSGPLSAYFPGGGDLKKNQKVSKIVKDRTAKGLSEAVKGSAGPINAILDAVPTIDFSQKQVNAAARTIAKDATASATTEGFVYEGIIQGITGAKLAGSTSNFDFPESSISSSRENLKNLFATGDEGIADLVKADAKRSNTSKSRSSIAGKVASDINKDRDGNFKGVTLKKAAGGSISDTVPALLTPGEYVLNSAASKSIGYSNLNRMNKQGVAGYNKGGPVGVKMFAKGSPGEGGGGLNMGTMLVLPALLSGLQSMTTEADGTSTAFSRVIGVMNQWIITGTSVLFMLKEFGILKEINFEEIKKLFGSGEGSAVGILKTSAETVKKKFDELMPSLVKFKDSIVSIGASAAGMAGTGGKAVQQGVGRAVSTAAGTGVGQAVQANFQKVVEGSQKIWASASAKFGKAMKTISEGAGNLFKSLMGFGDQIKGAGDGLGEMMVGSFSKVGDSADTLSETISVSSEPLGLLTNNATAAATGVHASTAAIELNTGATLGETGAKGVLTKVTATNVVLKSGENKSLMISTLMKKAEASAIARGLGMKYKEIAVDAKAMLGTLSETQLSAMLVKVKAQEVLASQGAMTADISEGAGSAIATTADIGEGAASTGAMIADIGETGGSVLATVADVAETGGSIIATVADVGEAGGSIIAFGADMLESVGSGLAGLASLFVAGSMAVLATALAFLTGGASAAGGAAATSAGGAMIAAPAAGAGAAAGGMSGAAWAATIGVAIVAVSMFASAIMDLQGQYEMAVGEYAKISGEGASAGDKAVAMGEIQSLAVRKQQNGFVQMLDGLSVSGSGVSQMWQGLKAAMGGDSIKKLEIRAKQETLLADLARNSGKTQRDANEALKDFKLGTISATEAMSALSKNTMLQMKIAGTEKEEATAMREEKSGMAGGFARGVARWGTLGIAGMMGLESGSQKNTRIEREATAVDLKGEERRAQALEGFRSSSKPMSSRSIMGGQDFDEFKSANASSFSEFNQEELDVLRKDYENQSKAIRENIAYIQSLNFGLRDVAAAADLMGVRMDAVSASTEAGFNNFAHSAATLEASVTAAGAKMTDVEFETALDDLETSLRDFGADEAQIAETTGTVSGIRDAQSNVNAALDAAKAKMESDGGNASDEAIKQALGEELLKGVEGPARDKIKSAIDKMEIDEGMAADIKAGNVEGIIKEVLDPIAEEVSKQGIDLIKKRGEAEQRLTEAVQKRRESELALIDAQKAAIDTQLEAGKLFEEFGGAKLTTDDQISARRSQANLSLKDAGIAGLQGGGAGDIKGALAAINRSAVKQADQVQSGTLGMARNATDASGKAIGPAFQGAGGIDADKREELKTANKAIVEFTKQRIGLLKEELQIAEQKNAAEKDALDKLLGGDIEGFLDAQIAAAAGAALKMGDSGVASAFGAGALGAGYKTLEGQGLSDREMENAASMSLSSVGITDPRAAQVMAGTTAEEEALKAEGRELSQVLGDAAQQDADLQELTVNTDKVVIHAQEINLEQFKQPAPAPGGFYMGGPVYANRGMFVRRGTDTVPAMLTPGEFVVNRNAVQAGNNLSILKSMNGGAGGAGGMGMHRGGMAYMAGGGFISSMMSGLGGAMSAPLDAATEAMQNNIIDPMKKMFDNPVMEKFANQFTESVQKLMDFQLNVKVDPTNVTVNFQGSNFLAGLKDNIRDELLEEVRKELKGAKFNEAGDLQSRPGGTS
jgi:TP901 family phage tail tape measure protein